MTSFTYGNPAPTGRAASLAQLCALENTDFVRCAYFTVLGRQPDPDGMTYYLERLAQGVSKLTLLRQLRTSPEAAHHDPGIAGFDRALRRHRLGNRPFVGWLVRLFNKAEPDTARARRERAMQRQLSRIEGRLMASHIDGLDRLEEILLVVRHLSQGAPVASYGRPSSQGGSTEFGLSRAGGGMAVPWSEIASN